MKNLRIFSLNSGKSFAKDVCDYLDTPLSPHIEKLFPDKEPYIQADVNVRKCDVFVICSLYTDTQESASDKFVKLLLFIGSLQDASADRITLVAPYLFCSRQDRKVESRAPVATKYLSMLLESVSTSRILTLDVHNLSALQNGFRIPTDHLEAKNLMVNYVAEQLINEDKIVVLSPDSGGTSRADRFHKALSVKLNKKIDLANMAKIREGLLVHGHRIGENIEDKVVIIVDDMISSGSTAAEAVETATKQGGKVWGICASHGLFVGTTVEDNLSKLNKIVVTDSIPCSRKNVTVLPTARLFARAIHRIHDDGGSISELLK